MLLRTTDRFMNPWSSQRHTSGQDLIDLSLALQSTNTSAKVLNNKVGFLDAKIDQIFRHLDLPGKYEDPSTSGTLRRKNVTFQDPKDEQTAADFIEFDDPRNESLPLIEVHQPPLAASHPTPAQTILRSTTATNDRPYIQMKPKLPPKKRSPKAGKALPIPPALSPLLDK